MQMGLFSFMLHGSTVTPAFAWFCRMQRFLVFGHLGVAELGLPRLPHFLFFRSSQCRLLMNKTYSIMGHIKHPI